nr:hypothetical protein [Spirochaeta sp.]
MDKHSDNVHDLLQRAAELIVSHHLPEANQELERALSIDFDHEEVVTSLKYSNFWNDRQQRVEGLADPFERGEYLLTQWNVFQGFVDRVGPRIELTMNAFRQHVFR